MADLQGQRVAWVTGAAGFIGQHVSARLAADGWTVIGIDRANPPRPTDRQVVGEISPALLERTLEVNGSPALVFHGAGTGSVGVAAGDPVGARRDTVTGTETMLAFLLRHAPRARVVFPSSAAVYGDTDDIPLAEDRALKPFSAYGEFKLAAEQACADAAREGLSVAIVRLFSVYGPGLRKQLPWDLGQRLLSGSDRLELFGTGAETRDFLNVADVAGLVAFLADAQFTSPLIVNGGWGIATRVDSFAAQFAETLGVSTNILFNGQTRAGDPKHFRADTRRLDALGFKPKISLHSGLTEYAAWLRNSLKS